DDELLDVATQGKLSDPAMLERQVRRMLADPKAGALTSNFASQWLFLRDLKNAKPEAEDFDENLRQSLRRETEMLFDSIVKEDRERTDGKVLAMRQRMEEHRSNPSCASCHKIMDPIGFSLENFDLTGKWRDTDMKTPIDASGELVDGTRLNGPASLRQALLS